jgi:hypothetical protein
MSAARRLNCGLRPVTESERCHDVEVISMLPPEWSTSLPCAVELVEQIEAIRASVSTPLAGIPPRHPE